MSVEIIRVEEPTQQGWGARALSVAKERPYLAALAAPGLVVAAPFVATTAAAVGGAAAGGVALAAAGELIFGPSAKPPVTLYSIDEAKGLRDVHHQPLMRGLTYMRLPRAGVAENIIRSSEFHAYVMSQKVAEIIHYMRSETRLKALSVLIRSSDRKHIVVGGELEKVSAKAAASREQQHERRMTATYDDRTREKHLENYSWIKDFPEVVAATRNARHGTMSFSQSTDMSFGMSAGVAKFAGFKAGWLSTFVVEVEATFS